MTSPLTSLDPVIHAPKRLAAMAMLDAAESADFTFLREHLGLSDSDLSKQMSALAQAGYVTEDGTRAGGCLVGVIAGNVSHAINCQNAGSSCAAGRR